MQINHNENLDEMKSQFTTLQFTTLDLKYHVISEQQDQEVQLFHEPWISDQQGIIFLSHILY